MNFLKRGRLTPAGTLFQLRWLIFVLALILGSGPLVSASDPVEIAAQWRAVTRIQGTISLEFQSSINESNNTADFRETARVRFTMVLDDDHGSTQLRWRAESAMITGSINGAYWVLNRGQSSTQAEFAGEPVSLRDFSLTLDPNTGAWQLLSPDKLRDKYEVLHSSWGDPTPGYPDRTNTELSDSVQSMVFNGTVATKPGPTYGSVKDEGILGEKATRPFSKIAQLNFYPLFDDVEVEVTLADYEKWRPLGSIAKPTMPGNNLMTRATLVPKAGQTKALPKVKNFRFALLDSSREPGVVMNWPLGASDKDFDLRLAAATGFAGTLANNDQQLDISVTQEDKQGHPFSQAQIDSYDFGGRASLRVTCTLADGREIVGVLKSQGKEEDLIRLPKMNKPGWIADSWRKLHKVEELADDDDNEQVEDQQDNGDGFTLYEEYRGFVVAGKRIEGDPEQKDFFVLNLIGADAEPGIDLFEQLSELRVHAKLRRSEMSETKRLMNGNHLDAPHRVDQHGVWVKAFLDDPKGTKDGKTGKEKLGDSGAATSMTEKGVAGRPGITKGVGILARDNTESVFNQPFNLPAQDSIFAFDRAIAHELLHSVGAEHHGSGDYHQIMGYVSPRNPYNKIGRPYYGTSLDKPIGLLDEEGNDVATKDYEEYLKFREFLEKALNIEKLLEEGRKYLAAREGYDIPIKTPQQYVDAQIEVLGIYCFMHLKGIVGVEHGEHSGDQDCLMRYYFAKFYEAKGAKTETLYVVTPGTERIGMQICRDGTGTGINASDHKPQSRYGDTASDAGNCISQICPNDAIPPRKVK